MTEDTVRLGRIWRSPTWVLARVWPSIGIALPLVALAAVLALTTPHERKIESIDAIDTPASLDAELRGLFDTRTELTDERREVEALPAADDAARAMVETRVAQLIADIEALDDRAVSATRLAGLRCTLISKDFIDHSEVDLACEGPELDNMAPLGWMALGGLVSLFAVSSLMFSLFWERRLIPYSNPRTRLLPPLVLSIGALIAPPVVWGVVFFARVGMHSVPLAGGPDPLGIAVGGVLLAVSISVLIYVGLTAPVAGVTAIVSVHLVAAGAISALAAGAGVLAGSGVALGGGAALIAGGLLGARRSPGAGLAAILGLELVAWGAGMTAIWAQPGGWSWGVVVLAAVLAAPSFAALDHRLRSLVPQGLGPPTGVLLS